MSRQISVSLPVNLDKKDNLLFLPYVSYELIPLKIKKIKNAFVTYSGFCLTKNGLLKECHHDYPGQYMTFLKEASQYYHDASDDPEKLIELDDEHTYLLIHHPWFMYYHWICEAIFRLWMVRDKVEKLVLLLPESYKNYDFVLKTIEPFKFKAIFFIPEGKSLMVRNLCVPQIKPLMEGYDSVIMHAIVNFYQKYTVQIKKKVRKGFGERIYISRGKAGKRQIENDKEVIKLLLKYHFTILYNEDFSFWEQIAIYSQARYLVSIHGSGLTNMIFMQPGSRILEFHKRKTNPNDWHSLIFWYLADAAGHYYYHQICEPDEPDVNLFTANLIVDIDLLNRNLALICQA
jgi:capsular polysaccharide biosynthesis protein